LKLFAFLLIVIALVLLVFFFYQGRKSRSITAPQIAAGNLPMCGAAPNCVCSQQAATDSHFVEPISHAGVTLDKMEEIIESSGGVVVSRDGDGLHAKYTSGFFKFVDDLLIIKNGDTIHLHSSSRVGHSDLGANRKRVERLRQMLLEQ